MKPSASPAAILSERRCRRVKTEDTDPVAVHFNPVFQLVYFLFFGQFGLCLWTLHGAHELLIAGLENWGKNGSRVFSGSKWVAG